MKPKRNLKLREEMFEKHWSLHKELLPYGFECGDGWLPWIDELTTKIEKLIEEKYPDSKEHHQVYQIKEKCSGGRYYIGSAPKEVHELISEYESKSYTICEHCGKSGIPRDLPWVLTLCGKCYAKHINRK